MKVFLAILLIALAVVASGCGGDDAATGSGEGGTGSTTASSEREADPAAVPDQKHFGAPTVLGRDDPRFATITGDGRLPKPEIDPADRPPPKRFLVRDIKVGSGPRAKPGDRVAVWYIGVDYLTGNTLFETWAPLKPLVAELGLNGNAWDWEEGIVGMRVGGRREMLVPSSLALGREGLDYIFDLVRVEPAAGGSSGG